MVTMPGGARPPTPVQLQSTGDRSENVSNSSGSQSSSNFGFVVYPAVSSSRQGPTSNNGFNSIYSSSAAAKSEESISNFGGNPNSSTVRMDFWRLPDKNIRFRPTKRPNAFLQNGSDEMNLCPQPKIRITEDKMAARLRNFHISSSSNNVDSNWFFMERPNEMFTDIESRLSDDEEEDNAGVNENTDSGISDDDGTLRKRKTLAVSGALKRILAADLKRAANASFQTKQSNPCTDIVLWKPPSDFIKDIVPSLSVINDMTPSSSISLNDCSSRDECMIDKMDNDRRMNFSGPNTSGGDDFAESSLHQRRNARQYSKPIIDVLNLASSRGNNCPSDLNCESIDDPSTMDVDE